MGGKIAIKYHIYLNQMCSLFHLLFLTHFIKNISLINNIKVYLKANILVFSAPLCVDYPSLAVMDGQEEVKVKWQKHSMKHLSLKLRVLDFYIAFSPSDSFTQNKNRGNVPNRGTNINIQIHRHPNPLPLYPNLPKIATLDTF